MPINRRCRNCSIELPEALVIEGRVFCDQCISFSNFHCSFCLGVFPIRTLQLVRGLGELMFSCPSCIREGYVFICEVCNEYFPDWLRIIDEDTRQNLCPSCHYQLHHQVEKEELVHPYSYRPTRYNFLPSYRKGMLYIGMELEVNCKKKIRKKFHSAVSEEEKVFFFKRDGSLDTTEGGVEIVTQPMTVSYMRRFLSRSKDYIKKMSAGSVTYGIHFHINKDFFGRIDYQFQVELQKAWNKIIRSKRFEAVVGRSPNRYCLLGSGDEERHYALNIQNPYTYEFRSFASTTDVELIRKKLNLVVSFCKVVRKFGASCTDLVDKVEEAYHNRRER